MVKELNSSPCGRKMWLKDKNQDLTESGGCADIGLIVPSLSLELARLENRKSKTNDRSIDLYLGQPSTDTASKINSGVRISERSTSYGDVLVKCNEGKQLEPEAQKLVMKGMATDLKNKRSWTMFLEIILIYFVMIFKKE